MGINLVMVAMGLVMAVDSINIMMEEEIEAEVVPLEVLKVEIFQNLNANLS